MASTKKTNPGNKSSSITRTTDKEKAAMAKRAMVDMKRLGFKTPEELQAYYDSKRGY